MSRKALIRFLVLVSGLMLFVFISVYVLTSVLGKKGTGGVGLGGDKIAVVEIKGIIIDSKRVLENLKRFAEDRNIKGIILRIDSPGGAVAPSQEIYSEVRNIQKAGEKSIVASFGNVAASGGYYVAAATERIVSNPGTITGSIGVIMEMSNIEKLLEKVGIESYVIKSGKFKDIGSPTRPMTEDERIVIQNVLDDVYMQFIEDVAKARGMELEKVRQIANGSIFSGRQALGLGLVDQLGSFQDAVDLTKELAGIEGDPTLIYERRERLDWLDYVAKGVFGKWWNRNIDSFQSGAFFLMP
jgi:protease-4